MGTDGALSFFPDDLTLLSPKGGELEEPMNEAAEKQKDEAATRPPRNQGANSRLQK